MRCELMGGDAMRRRVLRQLRGLGAGSVLLLTHSNRLWFALRSPCGLGCGSGWCGCRSDLSEAELRRFGWWGWCGDTAGGVVCGIIFVSMGVC